MAAEPLAPARVHRMRLWVVLLALGSVAAMSAPTVRFVARWGGVTKDIAYAIVTNDAKGLFVVGATYSPDFPVTAGTGPSGEQWCAFAANLSSSSGSVVYSTVLCSRGMTFGRAAAPADAGGLWIGGSTDGRGLPVSPEAFQKSYGGYQSTTGPGDGFIAKLTADGRVGSYATYLGGAGDDIVHSLLADGNWGVWASGRTSSRNFPVTDNARSSRVIGTADGFLAHLDASGRVLFSTFVGGSGSDEVNVVSRFDADRLLLAGSTSSREFGAQAPERDDMDGFIALFDTRTKRLDWFRRLGGIGDDRFTGIARLHSGAVVAVGYTESACSRVRGERDGWVAVLSPEGRPLQEYCVGGENLDEIHGAAVSGDRMWVTGSTRSVHFPGGWQKMPGLAAGSIVRPFVARLAPMQHSIEDAWLLTPHFGRGNAIAIGGDGLVFASGETTDAGNRFLVPQESNLVPTQGAFSIGAQRGSTDPYVVAIH